MREQLVNLILQRLNRDSEKIAADFTAEKGIADAFPDGSEMRLMKSFREHKYTSKSLDKYDPIIANITFAFQDKSGFAKKDVYSGKTT